MKTSVIFFLLILIGFKVLAQNSLEESRFALNGGIGYNFPVAGGNLASNSSNGNVDGIYGSWSKGLVANLEFGTRI